MLPTKLLFQHTQAENLLALSNTPIPYYIPIKTDIDDVISKLIATTGLFSPMGTKITKTEVLMNMTESLLFYSTLEEKCAPYRPGNSKFGQKAPLVVDIGGNLGWFTLLAASLGCRVHVFEPIPFLYQNILDGLEINGFGHAVTAHQMVVGAGNCTS